MADVVYRQNTKVIAPGEKKGTTEQGVVEKVLRSGKIRVVFSDNSYGVFKKEQLSPVRRASREERKQARQESARTERRAKLSPEEQAEAIKIFNELTGHKEPAKSQQVGDRKAAESIAYANALEKMQSLETRQKVYRTINWACGMIYKGKAVLIVQDGRLITSKASGLTVAGVLTFAAEVSKKKPVRYVLNTMSPDAMAVALTINVTAS